MHLWKRLFLYFYIILFLPLLAGCNNEPSPNLKEIKIAGEKIRVEVADAAAERYQGLSGRESMAADEGMLFVFDQYTTTNFVMRDMLFPLDIIWIKDNAVVGCSQNLPAPKAGESPVTVGPPEPVNYALEVNGGWCEQYKIQGGEKIEIN